MRGIGAGPGKPDDDASERISRCLLAECRRSGLRRVDHVVMGSNSANLFAVEGSLHDPAHARAHVATEHAIRTPVEQSDERLLVANQATAQRAEMAHLPNSQDIEGPRMHM